MRCDRLLNWADRAFKGLEARRSESDSDGVIHICAASEPSVRRSEITGVSPNASGFTNGSILGIGSDGNTQNSFAAKAISAPGHGVESRGFRI
jgi:hypothetical protein